MIVCLKFKYHEKFNFTERFAICITVILTLCQVGLANACIHITESKQEHTARAWLSICWNISPHVLKLLQKVTPGNNRTNYLPQSV